MSPVGDKTVSVALMLSYKLDFSSCDIYVGLLLQIQSQVRTNELINCCNITSGVYIRRWVGGGWWVVGVCGQLEVGYNLALGQRQ